MAGIASGVDHGSAAHIVQPCHLIVHILHKSPVSHKFAESILSEQILQIFDIIGAELVHHYTHHEPWARGVGAEHRIDAHKSAYHRCYQTIHFAPFLLLLIARRDFSLFFARTRAGRPDEEEPLLIL